jgi:hypothetical protein
LYRAAHAPDLAVFDRQKESPAGGEAGLSTWGLSDAARSDDQFDHPNFVPEDAK